MSAPAYESGPFRGDSSNVPVDSKDGVGHTASDHDSEVGA